MASKKRKPDLTSQAELVAREQLADPEFSADWRRLAIARAVAARVIAYRSDHRLSQSGLAKVLEMPQPQVSRLESGEHDPSHDMLARLASKLDMEFTISITNAKREPKQIVKKVRDHAAATVADGDSVTRFGVS